MQKLHRRSKRRPPLYLIPVLIGIGGVLFAGQLDDLALRGLVLLFSVAVPLLAVGNLLARYQRRRTERLLLIAGVIMLMLGAALTASGILDDLVVHETTAGWIEFSRLLGLFSLMLGLFVILYTMVNTGEDIEEVGQRFWHLAEHMSEGFVLSSVSGTITLVNRQFLEMFDLREEEVVGQNAPELAQRLHLSTVRDHFDVRAKGIASEYEVDWRVRDEQRRFWFKGTPVFDRQGKHTANLATVRDITEHHQLSQRVERYARDLQQLVEEQTSQLLRSDKRFRKLLMSMNEGFLTIDAGHRIRFVNERICELLKVAREDLIGRDIFDFVEPKGRVRLLSVLARGEDLEMDQSRQELNFTARTGEEVAAMLAVAYIRDNHAEEAMYSLVVTSLAEQKQMQRQLLERARDLEKANQELLLHGEAKDRFLSNVSHELRTPLSTIQGYVEILISGSMGALQGPQLGALQVMERNVKRLIGHINEMIEFSRMEIRGIQLAIGLFSPKRLVTESVASVHPQAVAKDVTVEHFVPPGLPPAWGDGGKLAQVLGIFLNNATKFTESGGLVRVQVAEGAGRTLSLTVSDTGIGIPAAHHEQIFDKFYQVDSSMARRYEGTGIGLSIAKSIVEAHGGHIEVESEPGRGASFTAVLPGAFFDTEPVSSDVEGLHGLQILMVTQNKEFSVALKQALEPLNCRLEQATNGHEALRAAQHLKPDVVLLNDSSADVAGLNTLALFREHPESSTVPVIVLSGESAGKLREAGAQFPDVVYLQNPFSASTLIDRIRLAVFGDFEAADLQLASPDNADGYGNPHVLVIDSDPGLLEWVDTALARRGIPCVCTFTLDQALEVLEKERPDLVLIDIDVPAARAVEHVARLQQTELIAGIPIYVMTGLPERPVIADEVSGVLHKPFGLDALLKVVFAEMPAAVP